MKKWLALVAALGIAGSALAQAPEADGEVTKVDKAQSRITLKHGEIKALDMPPMTMVYRVRDAKLLEGVAVGQKVRFVAEKVDGNYTVTRISPR